MLQLEDVPLLRALGVSQALAEAARGPNPTPPAVTGRPQRIESISSCVSGPSGAVTGISVRTVSRAP